MRSFEALRQNLLDARPLLSWLLAEDERPVGVMGLSLGGALTLALTCLDDRFAFSIPLIAHVDPAAMVADAPLLATMRRDLRRFAWGVEDFREFVTRSGWYDLRPRLPVDRIHIFAASDDHFFGPVGRRGDVAALGGAGDPLVPIEPHGIPAARARSAVRGSIDRRPPRRRPRALSG